MKRQEPNLKNEFDDATLNERRRLIMRHNDIDAVIDVGANTGQYGRLLRRSGYTGVICSYEPLDVAYQVLQRRAAHDGKWFAAQVALGDADGSADFFVSAFTPSSSLLHILPTHIEEAPLSRVVDAVTVEVRRLDSCIPTLVSGSRNLLLKMDTQGYEDRVLDGVGRLVQQVRVIECELSLVPLYTGQKLFREMMDILQKYGFEPVHLSPGFSEKQTGYSLQIEAIFVKKISQGSELSRADAS